MSDDQRALNDIPVVVSLTTIRSRLPKLHHVLRSLAGQDVKPEKIYLVVSREPRYLDEGVSADDLPEKVAAMVDAGVVSMIEAPNDGPYRKLLPVLRMYWGTDMFIATADDDSVYPVDWLSSMLRARKKAPDAVVAHAGRAMSVQAGQFIDYKKWRKFPVPPESYGELDPRYHPLFTLPIGKDGVLYHSGSLGHPDIVDELRHVAPLQDDLAFKAASMMMNIPVRLVAEQGIEVEAVGSLKTETQLYDSNHRQNSVAWAALLEIMTRRGFRLANYLSSRDP